jgi:shikimate kinase
VCDPAQRRTLADLCFTVWLEVEPAEAAIRLGNETRTRPLLEGADPQERLVALLGERRPFFEAVSAVRVSTAGRTPEDVAAAALRAWGYEG